MRRVWLFAGWLALIGGARAEPVAVVDDAGAMIRLPAPAHRVVTLAPHLAELLVAAGGGSALVGVSRFTDYPPEAANRPLVGDAHALDRERLLSLKPDLLLVWRGGMAPEQIRSLMALGIPIYQNEIRNLDDIPRSLKQIGVLLGREAFADKAANTWRAQLTRISRILPAGRKPVPAFYQIWHDPLYTVGQGHWLNDVLGHCGARNVFAELPALAPPVSREAVLESGAEVVVLGSGSAEARAAWARFPQFPPESHQRYCVLNPDTTERPGPRLLEGVRALCRCLDDLNL